MRILVVGAGAREHALCSTLAREPALTLLAAPGNPGMAGLAELADVPATHVDRLLALARAAGVDLTVVGPEAPLAAGLVDRFTEAGLLAFGPTRAAARLETSKAFAKAFMQRHGVPTARFAVCDDLAAARQAVDAFGIPVVLKADGLAAGKGVVVATDRETALAAIDAAMIRRDFGEAGTTLVVEECLTGPEASFFALCDGARAVPLGTAQDHKRAFDDDRGPNTGGMGAFAPAVVLPEPLQQVVMGTIVEPVVRGMVAEGCPFRGFLYVGLMLTAEGPKVIEFNVRFGDPEAQVVLPSVAEPLAPWLIAAARGSLPPGSPRRVDDRFVGVVMASGGYPGPFATGKPIVGLDAAAAVPGVTVFHAGTASRDGALVTDGGRVLTVVGRGPSYEAAMTSAYEGVAAIRFDGSHVRRDIGRKAILAG